MKSINKKNVLVLVLVCMLASAVCGFAQQPSSATPAAISQLRAAMNNIRQLYASGDYQGCRTAIDDLLSGKDEQSGDLSFTQKAVLYSCKALVIYAFREEGYQDQVKKYLLLAVQTDLNFDFEDYAIIPTYVVDVFIKTKREYMELFSKTTRRHSIGLYGSLTALPTIFEETDYLKPGIHYSFNINESFMLLADLDFLANVNIFNSITARAGIAWFPSFKVETVSMGLAALYGIKLEKNANTLHVVSIEGYGEFIFRFGMGFAASIELVRMDMSIGDQPGNFSELEAVEIFSSSQLRLSTGNLRVYMFWNF